MDAYRNFVELKELASIGLVRGQVARIDNGRGMRLRVEAGAVWVTEEQGGDDVCLKAGDAYRIDKGGKTLLSTLRAPFALVTIEPEVAVQPTTPIFVSRDEVKALRTRAAHERAAYLGERVKAWVASLRAHLRAASLTT